MQLEQLEPIIFVLSFTISYIRNNLLPIILTAVVTLVLREYFLYRANLRSERIQKYEKVIENVYGPLKLILKRSVIESYLETKNQIGIYEKDIQKIQEIIARYSHEIKTEITKHFFSLQDAYKESEKHPRGLVHYYQQDNYFKMLELVNSEYNSNISDLNRYRKMREGFGNNLLLYFHPFIFREKKQKKEKEREFKKSGEPKPELESEAFLDLESGEFEMEENDC